jgi:hypothetical protein
MEDGMKAPGCKFLFHGIIVGLLLITAMSVAQSKAGDTKDAKEIAAFKLTTDGLTKLSNSLKALDELSKKNPALREKVEDSDNGEETIDETLALYERHPEVISAIKSSGLTPREFVVTNYALVVNSMAMAYRKAGMKDVPPGASTANMNFIETHRKEIEAMNKEKKPQSDDEKQ